MAFGDFFFIIIFFVLAREREAKPISLSTVTALLLSNQPRKICRSDDKACQDLTALL